VAAGKLDQPGQVVLPLGSAEAAGHTRPASPSEAAHALFIRPLVIGLRIVMRLDDTDDALVTPAIAAIRHHRIEPHSHQRGDR